MRAAASPAPTLRAGSHWHHREVDAATCRSSHALWPLIRWPRPHPDDIEIGLVGIVARHAALGFCVGLCDLTQGERGATGHRGAAESRGGRHAARLRVAREPAPARSPHREAIRPPRAAAFIRRHRPRVAVPHWSDPPPDHRPSAVLTEAVQQRAAAVSRGGRALEAGVDLSLLNESAPPSFVVDVTDYEQKRHASDCQ